MIGISWPFKPRPMPGDQFEPHECELSRDRDDRGRFPCLLKSSMARLYQPTGHTSNWVTTEKTAAKKPGTGLTYRSILGAPNRRRFGSGGLSRRPAPSPPPPKKGCSLGGQDRAREYGRGLVLTGLRRLPPCPGLDNWPPFAFARPVRRRDRAGNVRIPLSPSPSQLAESVERRPAFYRQPGTGGAATASAARPDQHAPRRGVLPPTASIATTAPDAGKSSLTASRSGRWVPSDSDAFSGAPTLGSRCQMRVPTPVPIAYRHTGMSWSQCRKFRH